MLPFTSHQTCIRWICIFDWYANKVQWNLSITTTSKIKCITFDLFSNMFIEDWRYQFTLANNVCLLELMPPRWAPEGREVSYEVVIIDKFHCINDDINLCVIIWLFHYINQFKMHSLASFAQNTWYLFCPWIVNFNQWDIYTDIEYCLIGWLSSRFIFESFHW